MLLTELLSPSVFYAVFFLYNCAVRCVRLRKYIKYNKVSPRLDVTLLARHVLSPGELQVHRGVLQTTTDDDGHQQALPVWPLTL